MKFEIDKDKRTTSMLVDWAEVVQLYRRYVGSGYKAEAREFNRQIREWRDGTNKGFSGNTGEEMIEFLDRGYEFPKQIDADVLPVVSAFKKRQSYTDDPEGEYSHDLYTMGEPEFFLTTPKREKLIGIRLNVEYSFIHYVPAKVLGEYAQWVGGMINVLQTKGYDLEIVVSTKIRSPYRGFQISDFDIRVSRFGERVMPHDWSALFSPGGFRHFYFMLAHEGKERENKLIVEEGLGECIVHNYDINWDPNARQITIHNHPGASEFPADEMTKKFQSWTE